MGRPRPPDEVISGNITPPLDAGRGRTDRQTAGRMDGWTLRLLGVAQIPTQTHHLINLNNSVHLRHWLSACSGMQHLIKSEQAMRHLRRFGRKKQQSEKKKKRKRGRKKALSFQTINVDAGQPDVMDPNQVIPWTWKHTRTQMRLQDVNDDGDFEGTMKTNVLEYSTALYFSWRINGPRWTIKSSGMSTDGREIRERFFFPNSGGTRLARTQTSSLAKPFAPGRGWLGCSISAAAQSPAAEHLQKGRVTIIGPIKVKENVLPSLSIVAWTASDPLKWLEHKESK